jgi:hypothetical protein
MCARHRPHVRHRISVYLLVAIAALSALVTWVVRLSPSPSPISPNSSVVTSYVTRTAPRARVSSSSSPTLTLTPQSVWTFAVCGESYWEGAGKSGTPCPTNYVVTQ